MPRKLRALTASKRPTSARLVALRVPATINAAAATEGEQPGPPKFTADLYAGGALPGYVAKLDAPVVVDLKGMTPRRNMIANLDHAPKQRVGHIAELTNDGKKLAASGTLSAATPHRDEVVNSAKEGFQWEVSMEADLSKLAFLGVGQQATVNDQVHTGPLYIARKSVLAGLAFVSEGAEDGNSVSIAASKRGTTMDPFEKWLEEKGWEADTLNDTQRTTLRASYDREHEGTTPLNASRPKSVDEAVAAQRAENERANRINEMTRTALRAASGKQLDTIELLAKKAIDDGWGADRYELELYRVNMPQASSFRTGGRSEPDGRVLEAALARNAGLPDIEKHYSPEVLQMVDDHHLRGLGLQQLLLQAASQNGLDVRPGERISVGNLREVLEYAFPVGPQARRLRAASASTFSLPTILGNVANKELLVGFTEMVDPVIAQISAPKSANNFYARTHVRLTDSLKFEKVGPSGEIKHGTLSEEKFTTELATHAKFLGLNRQDIINDDLGALDSLRLRLGGGGAQALNERFWTVWLNDSTFWTTARKNYITGATTNLGIDGVGLEKAEIALAQLKTPDGKRLTIPGSLLLTPPELSLTARKLYVSSNVNTGGAATAESVPNANAFANKYRPLDSVFLSDSGISGSSETAWWLLRDPRTYPAAVVSYLNGQQTPTVESAAADFDVLGVAFRGYFDFDVALAEWLAGIKSKGAA